MNSVQWTIAVYQTILPNRKEPPITDKWAGFVWAELRNRHLASVTYLSLVYFIKGTVHMYRGSKFPALAGYLPLYVYILSNLPLTRFSPATSR